MPLEPATKAIQELNRSTALLTTGLNQLHTLIGQISSQVAGVVQLYNPVAFNLFNLAARDATAAVGRILTPALEKFTVLVRGLGDLFASVSPETQKLIQAITAAAIGIGVMTAAVVALDLAINTSLGGIPGLLGLIAGGAAGMAFALKGLGGIQQAVQGAMRTLSAILNAVGVAAQIVADDLKPVFAAFSGLASNILPLVEALAAQVIPIFHQLATGVAAAFQAMLPTIQAVLPVLTQLASTIIGNIGNNFQTLLPVLTAFAQIAMEMIPPLATLATGIANFTSSILQAVLPLIRTLFDVMAPLRAVFTVLLEGVGTVLSLFGGLISGFVSGLRAMFGPLAGALGGMGGAFHQLQRALGELGPSLVILARELGSALGSLIGSGTSLLTVLIGPITTAVNIFAGVVRLVASGLHYLAVQLRELLGVGAAGLGLDTFKPGAAEGLAVRNVQSGDLGSVIRRGQESAIQAGRPAGEDYPRLSAGFLEQIKDGVENLPDLLAEKLAIEIDRLRNKAENSPAATFLDPLGVQRMIVRSIVG